MVVEYVNVTFWKEFIELYKSLPALWDVNNVVYRNKVLKDEGYAKLISKLQRAIPGADKSLVRRKINSFRTNVHKEFAKVKKGKANGYTYVPSLWYFRLLAFIGNLHRSPTNEESSDSEENPLQSIEEIDIEEIDIDCPPSPKKIKVDRTTSDDEQSNTDSSVSDCTDLHNKLKEIYFSGNSELATITRCWDNEYNKLTPEQKMYAKKAIDDVLFEGRLGLLTKHSVMINSIVIDTSSYQGDRN